MSDSRRIIFAIVIAVVFPFLSAQAIVEVGEHIVAKIDTPTDYPGTIAGRETVVWSYELSHPKATYIAIHFTDFNLGPDDLLVVSDPAGDQVYALEGKGKMGTGDFWAQHKASAK